MTVAASDGQSSPVARRASRRPTRSTSSSGWSTSRWCSAATPHRRATTPTPATAFAEGEERYRLLETLPRVRPRAPRGDRRGGRRAPPPPRPPPAVASSWQRTGGRCSSRAGLRQVEGERENLRAALRWARDRADAESDGHVRDTLSRLAGRLTEPATRQAVTPLVFELRRLGMPAYAELERRLLEQPDQESLAVGADLCWFIGDHATEATLRRRRLELLEVAGDVRAAARGRVRYARLLVLQNHPQEGIALLDEVVRTAAELGDDELLPRRAPGAGARLRPPGGLPERAGRPTPAPSRCWRGCGPPCPRRPTRSMRLVALRGSGNTAHNADDNATCVANHAEALAIAQEYGHRHEEAMQWVNFADGQWGCGDYGAALKTYRRALRVSTAACYTLARGLASLGHGIVLWSVGRLPEAARALEDGLEIARDVGNAWWIAYGLTYLGNVRASQGDLDGARRLSREAVACAQESGVGYPLALSRMTASLLVASGIDLATVATILGHKNASVLLDVYARALRESKRDAAGRLQRLLYGPPSRVASHHGRCPRVTPPRPAAFRRATQLRGPTAGTVARRPPPRFAGAAGGSGRPLDQPQAWRIVPAAPAGSEHGPGPVVPRAHRGPVIRA